MIYTVTINNKEYEVEVEKGKANILKTKEIAIQKAPEPVKISAPAAEVVSAPAATAPAAQAVQEGVDIVKAPMPGTILNIKVNQGSNVKQGEILVILEAMKMENEILAPRDGVVTQMFVTKGSSVSTGDNLVSIS